MFNLLQNHIQTQISSITDSLPQDKSMLSEVKNACFNTLKILTYNCKEFTICILEIFIIKSMRMDKNTNFSTDRRFHKNNLPLKLQLRLQARSYWHRIHQK